MTHAFEVWVPHAASVELIRDNTRTLMEPRNGGWWMLLVEDIAPATDYAYSIDGGPAIPDPRSPWQPFGVHGVSRLLDHSTFEWTDGNWQARPLPSAILYELHIGTFTPTGTFDAAISKLDQLVDLGVTHIELMPVCEFSGSWGWGYDSVDLYAPHHCYGRPDDLKRLVNAAHAHGLAVLLDVVYNHLGPEGNYLSQFGPYFTKRHATPWGDAINLDGPASDEVRRFFLDNALMWLRDYHFDGLRIDAVHAIIDGSAIPFLEELAIEVEKFAVASGRHLVLIAESDLNNPVVVRPREIGGYGMDAQWSDDFHHALHAALTGECLGYYSDFGRLEHLAKALDRVFVYDGCYSKYRKRRHGRRVQQLPGYRFLGYIQTHDQVGNRATGRRISQLTSFRRAKIAAGLVLTSPFVPMLFQGEEWAASTPFRYFTQHENEQLARAVSEGRRNEFIDFGWDASKVPDPQDPSTFHISKLRWEERDNAPHSEMLAWYRTLIRLRKAHPSLTDGNLETLRVRYDEERRWITIDRGSLSVVCNLSSETQFVAVQDARRVLLASEPEAEIEDSGVRLGSDTLAVVVTRETP